MAIFKKIKNWYKRKRAKALYVKTGYWNGTCPLCHEHIGIDLFKDKLTHKPHATCASCNEEIYELIEV